MSWHLHRWSAYIVPDLLQACIPAGGRQHAAARGSLVIQLHSQEDQCVSLNPQHAPPHGQRLSERRIACYRRTGVVVSHFEACSLPRFAGLHVVKLLPGTRLSNKICMQQKLLRCSKSALPRSTARRSFRCHKALRPMGLLRGVIDSVSARLAFFPPSPPSYEVPELFTPMRIVTSKSCS